MPYENVTPDVTLNVTLPGQRVGADRAIALRRLSSTVRQPPPGFGRCGFAPIGILELRAGGATRSRCSPDSRYGASWRHMGVARVSPRRCGEPRALNVIPTASAYQAPVRTVLATETLPATAHAVPRPRRSPERRTKSTPIGSARPVLMIHTPASSMRTSPWPRDGPATRRS